MPAGVLRARGRALRVGACDEHINCARARGELDVVDHDVHPAAALLGWEMRFGGAGVFQLGVEEE